MTHDDDETIITLYINHRDGKVFVGTDLPDGIGDIDDIALVYMSSLVSLCRFNEIEDEEIPDIVRESLRSAMLGISGIEEEPKP